MRDAVVVSATVGLGFALLSGTVFYSASRIERALVTAAAAPPEHRRSGENVASGAGEGIKLNADGIRVDRVMTYDFFARYWRPDFARIAERECWAPLEQTKKYSHLAPRLQFSVEVDADGSVVAARQAGGGEDRLDGATELGPCIAKIIQTMRFAPSGQRQTGPAQADRP